MSNRHHPLPDASLALPYGWWECADGNVVLFNRLYQPMFAQLPSGEVRAVDPSEFIRYVKQDWFSTADPRLRNRHDPNVQDRLAQILDDFRLSYTIDSIKARAATPSARRSRFPQRHRSQPMKVSKNDRRQDQTAPVDLSATRPAFC